MLRARVSRAMLTGCLIVCGAATATAQAPKPEVFLKYHPKQDGVPYSTPDAKDVDACKVEAAPKEKGQTKGAGWMLRDPQGRPLRRFFDSNYDGKARTGIDVYSYYLDGVETYREQFVNAPEGQQTHFRWLNQGGSKWGIDLDRDGKIDTWKVISPEEVSQEIVQALVKNDFARVQALFITDAELKALDLPADLAKRIRDGRAAAAAKFKETQAKLALTDKSHWLHLETEAPHLIPVEGGREVLEHAHATVVIESAGKNDWVQTGELIQVGAAWRIIEAPAAGAMDGKAGPMGTDNPELQKLLTELATLDGDFSKKPDAKPAEVVKYNLDRTALIEKVIAAVKDDERGQWVRQEADCLAAAAQNSAAGDRAAADRLIALVAQVQKSAPAGDALAAYVTFREMQAWYYDQTRQKGYDFKKVHGAWLERLGKYVKDYPNGEDTPEALLGAGWVAESLGDREVEAKNWYQQLAKDFGDKLQGAKAKGALRRLTLEGSELTLAGPTLDGGSFDVSKLRGKVVIVYYWYTFNGGPVGDFAKLKLLLDSYAKQGLEVVTVSLDNSSKEAADFVKKTGMPGTHLYQEGGMDSKYAVDYGVLMLPTMFVVGKDGKVVSRTLQVDGVEEELKKQLAK